MSENKSKKYPDITDIIAIAHKAGELLMDMRDKVQADVKGDGTPVTEADRQSSKIVIDGFAALTPDIPVISEENKRKDNLAIQEAHDTYWIVDPLDGTRSYLHGHDGFGVHIALIKDGEPVIGVCHFPADGVTYFADENGSFCQHTNQAPQKMTVPDGVSAAPRLAVSWVEKYRPVANKDLPYEAVLAVGGARLCCVAAGEADLAVTERMFSYWDVAAAHAVLRAAGGELVELHTGERIFYEKGRLEIPQAIAGHEHVIKELRGSVADAVKKPEARPTWKP